MSAVADMELERWRRMAVYRPPLEVGGLGVSGSYFLYLTPIGEVRAIHERGHHYLLILDLFTGATYWPSALWPRYIGPAGARYLDGTHWNIARQALKDLCLVAGEVDPMQFGYRRSTSGRLLAPRIPKWLWRARYLAPRYLP